MSLIDLVFKLFVEVTGFISIIVYWIVDERCSRYCLQNEHLRGPEFCRLNDAAMICKQIG